MEYIEREKVLEIAKDNYYSDFHKSMADLISLRELLEDTPAADVVEVRHGRWIVKDLTPYCSVCYIPSGYECDGVHSKTLFCPNCGAKMDGKDGESWKLKFAKSIENGRLI